MEQHANQQEFAENTNSNVAGWFRTATVGKISISIIFDRVFDI